MLSRRIIPCLDVRDGKLTKGIKFKGNVDIGDPVEMARFYYEEGADEIVFYDITASSDHRNIMIDVVERTAAQIFIPFSVGGGISDLGGHAPGAFGRCREGEREFGRGGQPGNHP